MRRFLKTTGVRVTLSTVSQNSSFQKFSQANQRLMQPIRRLTLTLTLLACCSTASAEGVRPFCDALYWRASAATSAVWSSVIDASLFSDDSSFTAETLQFGWDPGFRGGVELGRPERSDSWDARLYWTNFHTSSSASAYGNVGVMPEFFSSFVGSDIIDFNRAAVDWGLTYNTIDLELGRKYRVSPTTWFRPSMGIKAGIIRQKARMDLQRDVLGLDLLSAEAEARNNFWGIGPSFGISGGWSFWRGGEASNSQQCGQELAEYAGPTLSTTHVSSFPKRHDLSLVGSFSADFLFGRWDVDDSYRRTDALVAPTDYREYTTSMNDTCLGTPVLHCFLGLQWVYQGKMALTAHAGYEMQWWANQQRTTTFQQLPMHGDLTIEGLTCGLSIDF